MTKADHNPLRAALERFGRERGKPQPRLYRTVDEEREFREAKEKYGIKDHWPQGQPQPMKNYCSCGHHEMSHWQLEGDPRCGVGGCACRTYAEQGQPQQEPAQSNAEPWIRHRFVTDPEICLECGQLRSFHPDQAVAARR